METPVSIDKKLSDNIALMLGYFREKGHKCWFETMHSANYVVASDDQYKSDFWDPKNNWNQLMKAFTFIEYLPREIRNNKNDNSEVIIDEICFNRYNVYIKVLIYKDNDWEIKYIGQHMSSPLSKEKKQEEWFRVIGEFAEFYNKNKELFK